MNNLNARTLLSEINCDKCQRSFYRQLTNKGNLTKINDINYWTDNNNLTGYQILCRGCLKDWYQNHHLSFKISLSRSKKQTFHQYRYKGLIDEKKELYKNEKMF